MSLVTTTREIQDRLSHILGRTIPNTGDWGPVTAEAVKEALALIDEPDGDIPPKPEEPPADTPFEQWFDQQVQPNFFNAREFLVKGRSHSDSNHRGYGLNTDPPRDLWPNILPTVRVLDTLRERLGYAVILSSVYRSPAYNRAIGSSNPPDPHTQDGVGSQHPRFTAADFRGAEGTPAEWAAELRRMRSEGLFRGGIGVYETFVHVDTRGTNADW